MCITCYKTKYEFWDTHRKGELEVLDYWQNRLTATEALGPVIVNGIGLFKINDEEKLNECMSIKQCEEQIDRAKKAKRKYTLYTKFFIYACNGDWENMKKYHGKLTENEMERMDDYQATKDPFLNRHRYGEGETKNDKVKGDGGYVLLCDHLKELYEEREKILKMIH